MGKWLPFMRTNDLLFFLLLWRFPLPHFFCMFFIYLFHFLDIFLGFSVSLLVWRFFISFPFVQSFDDALKSHWFEDIWLISRLPMLIKTKPMLRFCFHWLQKTAFFCFVRHIFCLRLCHLFSWFFPVSKRRILLRCCFLFLCYVCRFPLKLYTRWTQCLFFTYIPYTAFSLPGHSIVAKCGTS